MFMIRFRGRGQEAERLRVLGLNTAIAAPSDPADALGGRPADVASRPASVPALAAGP
jgi:hypothetical protein